MTVLAVRVATITLMLMVGNLFAEFLADWALADRSLTVYVRLAVFAAGGQLLWQFVSGYLSSGQYFGRMAFFLTTIPLLMLVSAVVLALMGRLDLTTSIVIVLFAPTATVLIWWPTLDHGFLRTSAFSRRVMARIARFSRWIYVTQVASSLRGHLNPLLLKNPALSGSVAAGEVNAGLYGFGNDLANELQMLSGAVVTVLMPKAASSGGPDKLRRLVRRCYQFIPLVILGLIPVMFLARPGLHVLSYLSPNYLEYLPSLRVFYVLYIGGLFSIATIPITTALYAMNLPQIEARVEVAMVLVLVAGGVIFIPRFGPEGAALSILLQRVITFVVLVGYGGWRLRNWSGTPGREESPRPEDTAP